MFGGFIYYGIEADLKDCGGGGGVRNFQMLYTGSKIIDQV